MRKRKPFPAVALLLSAACATPTQTPAPSAQVVPFVEMPVFARPMPGPLLQPLAPITIQPPDELLKPEPREFEKERKAANACGYDFAIGVSSQAHRGALFKQEPTFRYNVTGC